MKRGPTWRRRVGDTAPALDKQLRYEPTPGQVFGDVVDLTGVTTVHGVIRRHSDGAALFDGAVDIDDHATGLVSIVLDGTITAEEGLATVEWVATWPDRQITFPAVGDYDHLIIDAEVTSTAPAAPVPAGTGEPPSGGIMSWNGTAWVVDPDARHYIRYPSDPDPEPLMNANDILITIT